MSIEIALILVAIIFIILFSPLFSSTVVKVFRRTKTLMRNSSFEEEKISTAQEIQTAVDRLVSAEKGASIVIDVKNETNEYITDSELIDSRISSNLLINIFEGSKTPLHDGAAVIKGNRIDRASAMITNLSQSKKIPKSFGTRHRSALGLAEVTKAIIIVVSEETGKVRIFHKSKFEEVNARDLFGRIIDLWV